MAVGLPDGPSDPGHFPHTNYFFTEQPFERPQKGSTQPLKNRPVFSCLSLARLLILLMMSGNVNPNPCPIFPCLVFAGNVTWRGRSVQCCTCSNWVHLKCSLLSFYRFRTLGSSHFWSCPPFWISAFFGDPTSTSTVTSSSDSSSWFTFTA